MAGPVIAFRSRAVAEVEEESPAWLLAEGDQLAGGAVVVSVHREPVERTVRIATTTQPAGVTLDHDDVVRVARRVR